MAIDYGAILATGLLQGPGPSVPVAATRNQYLVPLVRFLIVAFEGLT